MQIIIILYIKLLPTWGFPAGASAKEPACQCRTCKRHGFSPCVEDPLEEGMAAHCSVPAWKTPWTEEPGWLRTMGSQRARHNWAGTPTRDTQAGMMPIGSQQRCREPRTESGPHGREEISSPPGPLLIFPHLPAFFTSPRALW